MTGVFSEIYRRNQWNGVETRSGPGSGSVATRRLRAAVTDLALELAVTSVTDVACGECFWQPELPNYVGLDVAPEAIARARARHRAWDLRVGDAREGVPTADLVICRDAMQHLSLEDGLNVLDAIRVSGSTWLLASTYVGSVNVDILTGSFFTPNLEAPPYDMPPALRLYHDGYSYHEPVTIRDPFKMMALWRL